ncbi:hypothetical protein Dimus_031492 [Dionaea muscipula]
MAEEPINLVSLLSSENRDFLVRNNGDQVKIKDLAGKNVGLYFSASWCPPCRGFTPILSDVYNQLSSSKGDFEVVFVSSDNEEDAFDGYFSKMPWLAVPFSDHETNARLSELFEVTGIPNLVIIDASGKISSSEGVKLVRKFGAEAYPFTLERINQLEEEKKRRQTLKTLLCSDSRDYVLSNDGTEIPISELEGQIVGLYFAVTCYGRCVEFSKKLVEVYHHIKERGEKFEVVVIPLDGDEEGFKQGFASMPWFSLPFKDQTCKKLVEYFELRNIPWLVILGEDGKTLMDDATDLIDGHGAQAYPFTPDKVAELAEIEKAKLESQTLESLLVTEGKDFVLDKSGSQVPVSSLVGKHVLLYFSAHWCPPCRHFTPELIEAYQETKAKAKVEEALEVIFISSDRDQSSYDEYYSSMPWLALPFRDERKAFLSKTFKVSGIPCLVAIGPDGKTITTEARQLVQKHGAEAFPFTADHIKQVEEQLDEAAKTWPKQMKHRLHEHELKLIQSPHGYICDGCSKAGHTWSYKCKECDFDLHPKCALKKDEPVEDNGHGKAMEGYICEGDVCRKI